MTDTLQPYEVYAIRYARHDLRRTSENFIGGAPDPHEDPLMPLDFFVCAIRGPNARGGPTSRCGTRSCCAR